MPWLGAAFAALGAAAAAPAAEVFLGGMLLMVGVCVMVNNLSRIKIERMDG